MYVVELSAARAAICEDLSASWRSNGMRYSSLHRKGAVIEQVLQSQGHSYSLLITHESKTMFKLIFIVGAMAEWSNARD